MAVLQPIWNKNLSISGEKLSSDSVSADRFVDQFPEISKGYSLDQIFNCDETGLYYKMLPGHTLATAHSEPAGTKKAKERVTINACSNASGSIKLPLLLIGKAKTPRCFRGLNMESLPVIYKNQSNSWMNSSIFQEWFSNYLVPEVQRQLRSMGQEEKAILILDNCAAHPSEEQLVSPDGKVIAKFLPPNVTALIQPMDQGVLESLKRVYRKSILRDVVSRPGTPIVDVLKKIDLLKVVETIALAWDSVSKTTIRNSWKKLIPLPDSSTDQTHAITTIISNDDFVEQFSELNIQITNDDVQQWMSSDGPGYEHMDEQGIVALVSPGDEAHEEEDDDDELPETVRCPISHAEAMEKIGDVLTWYRFQPEATASHVSWLVQLREVAAKKRENTRKQASICSYFKKRSADK